MANAYLNEPYLTPQHTVPTKGREAQNFWVILRALPETVRELLVGFETAEFLNRIQQEYRLSQEQRYTLAEFLRDLFLGLVESARSAERLTEVLSIKRPSALQILKNMEDTLLLPIGLNLSMLTDGLSARTPDLIYENGVPILRFRSVEDLLAQIQDYEPDERMQFLQDTKRDNRILVLKAFSQLKLGTDGDGKPVSFTELARKEAPDFSSHDWLDLLSEDPSLTQDPHIRPVLISYLSTIQRMREIFSEVRNPGAGRALHEVLGDALGRAKPVVVDYVRLGPYFAGIHHKESLIDNDLSVRFAELPNDLREELLAPTHAERIRRMILDGSIPENYGVAVAKIMFLVALGDLSPGSLDMLLGERMGLGQEQGERVAEAVRTGLLPDIVRLAPTATRQEPVPNPPITQPERSAKQSHNGKINEQPQVIDLRDHSPQP